MGNADSDGDSIYGVEKVVKTDGRVLWDFEWSEIYYRREKYIQRRYNTGFSPLRNAGIIRKTVL